jgi:hypothetical protein
MASVATRADTRAAGEMDGDEEIVRRSMAKTAANPEIWLFGIAAHAKRNGIAPVLDPVESKEWATRLVAYMQEQYPDLCRYVIETRMISGDLADSVTAAVNEFNTRYCPPTAGQ